MTEENIFACPSCGASLTPVANQTQVTCAYCGSRVTIPEALRETKAEISPETTRWIKIGIWGFVIFILVTTIVPLLCSLCGVLGGFAGAVVPFFVK